MTEILAAPFVGVYGHCDEGWSLYMVLTNRMVQIQKNDLELHADSGLMLLPGQSMQFEELLVLGE